MVINNIFQHMPTTMQQEGCSGCVDAYNFTVDQNYTADPQWQINSSRHHSVGDAFILHEGNVGNGYMADDVHGTSNFATSFRNYWNGRETLGGSAPPGKTEQTNPVVIFAYSRYQNLIGNVLGTAGYHTNYETHPSSTKDAGPGNTTSNHSIYTIGWSGDQSTYYGTFPNDTVAYGTTMRWGSYDTVNAAVRWVAAEVPSSLSPYGNALPASQTLPASFFLACAAELVADALEHAAVARHRTGSCRWKHRCGRGPCQQHSRTIVLCEQCDRPELSGRSR